MSHRSFSILLLMNCWNIRMFLLSSRTVSAFCGNNLVRHRHGTRKISIPDSIGMVLRSSSTAPSSLGIKSGEQETETSVPSVYLAATPENPEFEFQNILEDISNRLSLPKLEEEDPQTSSYSHCIQLMPYAFHSLQSYAIGIKPIQNSESNSRRNKRKKINPKKMNSMRPIYIDFFPMSTSSLGKRSQKADGEMLLKAISPSKYGGDNPLGGAIVYDLCAGFGQDSMLLASSTKIAKVHMVERDPVVGLLLEDALRRLNLISQMVDDDTTDSERAGRLRDKIQLSLEDSVSFCNKMLLEFDSDESSSSRPDVCYLDPMFPPRTKSAAVKKNMQVLHGLFQTNEAASDDERREKEERNLLQNALSLSKSRVVVKRPVNAPPLGYRRDENGDFSCSEETRRPSFELKGSINRFDVYMLL